MAANVRKFAIVTGASTGIGFELAKICLKNELRCPDRCRRTRDRAGGRHAAAGARNRRGGAGRPVRPGRR